MPAHLSPDTKLFLEGGTPGTARFLVALDRAARREDERYIESTGCRVRSSVGDVLTLECDRAALLALMAWPRLLSVELSAPLHPESR